MGNFDYLMGENIDFRNHAVTEEIKYWAAGSWNKHSATVFVWMR
jgi:hypothetical protein